MSGPNESAANGSFKPPPRLVGRLGQETVDAAEHSVACHWQCQCPLQHPVLLVNPGRPLAPECGEGGPRVPCRVAWPALLRRLGGCSRKTLSRGGYYWVVGGPGSMCPESVPCGPAGKGIRRHNRHIVLYSPFVSRLSVAGFALRPEVAQLGLNRRRRKIGTTDDDVGSV